MASAAASAARNGVAKLGYELLSNGHPGPKKTIVFMHGILGSLKNWKTPSRKIVARHPHYQALLIDHRGHGASEAGGPPHSLEACAADVHELLRSLNLRPDILCGHSFGGKIALAYVKEGIERDGWEVPRQTWIFDSLPGQVHRDKAIGENSVAQIIDKLGQVPMPQPTKEGLVHTLIHEKKVPPSIAHWLMTSLSRHPGHGAGPGHHTPGGYVWAFDLAVVRSLFDAYAERCFYGTLASPFLSLDQHRIDFVRAGKNTAWTPDVLAKFDELRAKGRTNVHLHTLPNAGHWVHVDALEELLALMDPTFLPPAAPSAAASSSSSSAAAAAAAAGGGGAAAAAGAAP